MLCLRLKLECHYSATYTRGRPPQIPLLIEHEKAHQACSESDRTSNGSVAQSLPGEAVSQFVSIDDSLANEQMQSLRNSPEPPQDDLDGHYVGPSSGISFLLRAQKRVHESVNLEHSSSVFTFGDAPLPKCDIAFLEMPSKNEAQNLVAHYFDFAYPTHRFLHRPTIENWLEDFYASFRGPIVTAGVREKRALLLMVMASAKQFSTDGVARNEFPESSYFFAASEHCLNAETGRVRLTSVQARLAQCYYLITQSRLNHCWSLFGTAVRLAFAIGLHRRKRGPVSGDLNHIEEESRKRTFWCTYSLDIYLSAALGRPRSIHDEDIDQDLPSCVDDSELRVEGIFKSPANVQSVMLAPLYHIKLSRIIASILRSLYGIQKLSLSAQLSAAEQCEARMADWRAGISSFIDHTDKRLLKTLYQRQHTVLNLTSAHATILLYRPFLLRNFASLTQSSASQQNLQAQIAQNIEKCLLAALKIVGIVQGLQEDGKLIHALWFTHYYAFCAVVVLYVYVIQQQSIEKEQRQSCLAAAERCQNDLATCAQPNSFVQRCGVVLDELKEEALRRLPRPHPQGSEAVSKSRLPHLDFPQNSTDRTSPSNNLVQTRHSEVVTSGWPINQSTSTEMSPTSFGTAWAGWEDFDSFVIAGAGSLEQFLCHEFEAQDGLSTPQWRG